MTGADDGITQGELEQLFETITDDPHAVADRLEGITSIEGVQTAMALNLIGLLVDASSDIGDSDGLTRALDLSRELGERDLSPGARTRLNYRIANAYSHRRKLAWQNHDPWVWEDEQLEQEILHFRRALTSEGIDAVEPYEQGQIYTNLGNAFSEVGRIIEAIDCWQTALQRTQDFAPARGQLGIGYYKFATAYHDEGHRLLFVRMAYDELVAAIEADIHPSMARTFKTYRDAIEAVFDETALEQEPDLDGYSHGDSDAERAYREWCLNNRLFLNPLNELGAYPIANHDVLHLASVASANESRIISSVGLYNHLKQEFVSARYLLYAGLTADGPHVSDKDVKLVNTLDYPVYSFAAEQTKAAFRIAYGLFDKIGFFLNHYFQRGIAEHRVNFKTVWEDTPHSGTLAPLFDKRENWALRGLYWLSKDLQYRSEMYAEASFEPGAKELADIRNALEHRYLKLHDTMEQRDASTAFGDELAMSLHRDEFEAKALTMLQKARAALVYLSLAVRWEEEETAEESGAARLPFYLGEWEDAWKQ